MSKRPRFALWVALAMGLALRAGYAWYAQSHHFLPTDADEYEAIAVHLAQDGRYASWANTPTAHREPGFPFLIAAVYALCGGRQPWALLALNVLMSLLTGVLAMRVARRLFDEKAALGVLWTWMLYPQAVYYCGYFFRETFTTLLITALVYSSMFWYERQGRRTALLGGGMAAAAGLTNSGLLPAAVFSGLALTKRRTQLALYLLPIVLGVTAWTARNYALTGKVVLGTTHGGEELYQALVVPPEDLGTERQTLIHNADPTYQQYSNVPEAERNAGLTKAGLRWIEAHPGLYAERALAGLVKFWRLWPYQRRYDHAYWKLVLASVLFDGWLVPLGLFGLFVLERRTWPKVPAAPLCVAATTLLYGLVHAVIRYRLPLMPTVAVFAFGTIRRRL